MRRHKRSTYQALEPRKMLAAVSTGFGDVPRISFSEFATNEVLSISQAGEVFSYKLISGDTWTGDGIVGNPDDIFSGIGTDTVTFDRSEVTSHSVFGRNVFEGEPNPETVDIVFASDIEDAPFIFNAESVSQTEGTSVNVTQSIRADSIVLTEAGNTISYPNFIFAEYVELESDNPIRIFSGEFGSGSIISQDFVEVGGSSFFNQSRWHISGTITVKAGTSIDINSGEFGVTGRLNLEAPDEIRILSNNTVDEFSLSDFNGLSRLDLINFKTDGLFKVDMSQDPGPFRNTSPNPDTGPFNDPVPIPIRFVGDNTAGSIEFNVPDASLTDAAGATLNVLETARFTVNNVFLADSEDNQISIDWASFSGIAQLNVDPLQQSLVRNGAVFIADAGDVSINRFRSESTNFLTLNLDDSVTLLDIGGDESEFLDTRLVNIKSTGDIQIGASSQIDSADYIFIQANGRLHSQLGGDSAIKARTATFVGDDSIDLERIETNTLEYRSVGDVNIHSTSNITLRGNNRGSNVVLNTLERVASTQSTFVSAQNLTLAGRSIWIGNQAGEVFDVSNRLTLLAHDGFVIVGNESSVQAAGLNVQTDYAKVRFARNINFVGDNELATGIFSATANITDALNATFRVDDHIELRTPGSIFLGDGSVEENRVYFCGHAIFAAEGFVSVHRNGDVVLNTWDASTASGTWIHPDRRSCSV